MNNIKEYYLDLDKVMELPSTKRNIIMEMYRDMVHSVNDSLRKDMVQSYFNTLEIGGFIKNRTITERENKLGDLING
jgi:DNA-binding cell septation regulator SpoVG